VPFLGLGDSDCSIVAFGSLARREFTSDSDLDWSLLIDGAARSSRKALSLKIEERLQELKWKKPNPAGAFGTLTFSHDLVHSIGGESDSNRNTTGRIVLLPESINLGWSIAKSRHPRPLFRTRTRWAPSAREKEVFPAFPDE